MDRASLWTMHSKRLDDIDHKLDKVNYSGWHATKIDRVHPFFHAMNWVFINPTCANKSIQHIGQQNSTFPFFKKKNFFIIKKGIIILFKQRNYLMYTECVPKILYQLVKQNDTHIHTLISLKWIRVQIWSKKLYSFFTLKKLLIYNFHFISYIKYS